MKLLRLAVEHFRGIERVEVAFAPEGITLVQGPNEAGKSSLAEAIGILFEYPDSSQDQNVVRVRPVHADTAPEIALEAECGPYRFTYAKRFHRKPSTTLAIVSPKPENLTGRAAHNRATQLLAETVDMDLWKALSVRQGTGLDRPVLGRHLSLSAALDRAAGGAALDPREEGIFERVREEYLNHFGASGAEKKELAELRRAAEDARQAASRATDALQALERDLDAAAARQRELAELDQSVVHLGRDAQSHGAALERVARLEADLAAARLAQAEAAAAAGEASRRQEARRKLQTDGEAMARAADAANEVLVLSAESLDRLEGERRRARQQWEDADRRLKAAETTASHCRRDLEYRQAKIQADALDEKLGKIRSARERAARADAEVRSNPVTPSALKAIREADHAWRIEEAKLAAGAPKLTVKALGPVEPVVDGTVLSMSIGDCHEMIVTGSSSLALPGVLEAVFTAGAGTDQQGRTVETARRQLETALGDLGVPDAETAQRRADARREAEQIRDEQQRLETMLIGADSLDGLETEWLRLTALTSSYPAARADSGDTPEWPPDPEAARAAYDAAENARQEAARAAAAARDDSDAIRDRHEKAGLEHREHTVERDRLFRERDRLLERLQADRSAAPDGRVDGEAAETAQRKTRADEAVATVERNLALIDPERTRTLAETARGSLATAVARRDAVASELKEIRMRLRVRGEEGLHEQAEQAQVRLERAEYAYHSRRNRAEAAKLLYDTMREERDRKRKAYVAPLTERIDRLGRLVFNATFRVEVDDKLTIVQRTLDGRTVAFESLSGGAREQLALIYRLACSLIVAGDADNPGSGVPLLLDDVLGYTDPERLPLVGAALAQAARQCQIVIFTCVPDRYRAIGPARVVSL